MSISYIYICLYHIYIYIHYIRNCVYVYTVCIDRYIHVVCLKKMWLLSIVVTTFSTALFIFYFRCSLWLFLMNRFALFRYWFLCFVMIHLLKWWFSIAICWITKEYMYVSREMIYCVTIHMRERCRICRLLTHGFPYGCKCFYPW